MPIAGANIFAAIAGFSADDLNIYDQLTQKSGEKKRVSIGTHRPILITRRSNSWIRGAVNMMMSKITVSDVTLVTCCEKSPSRLWKNLSLGLECSKLKSMPCRHFSMPRKYGVGLENRFFLAQTIEPLSGIAEIIGLRVMFERNSAAGRQPSRPFV